MSLNPPNTPNAIEPDGTETLMEDVEEALLATLARLNSHHGQLQSKINPIED